MKGPAEVVPGDLQIERLRTRHLTALVDKGGVQFLGVDVPLATISPIAKTMGVVELPAPAAVVRNLAARSFAAAGFEQDERDEARALHDGLTPMDRAWVARTAALIRENVLRDAGSQAAAIADAVVAKLREEPVKITEPERVFIDAAEAAAILGITREAFDKRVQRRQVPGVVRTAGRRIQIDKAKMLTGLAKRGR